MNYKVLSGTALFTALWAIRHRIDEVRAVATKLAQEQGTERIVENSRPSMAGGIRGFELPEKPTGWRGAFTKSLDNCYFPKRTAQNKALIERIEALPTVQWDDVNEIIGFKRQLTLNRFMWGPNVIAWGSECVIIRIDEQAEYTPLADMIEITTSEFNALREQIQAEAKATTPR